MSQDNNKDEQIVGDSTSEFGIYPTLYDACNEMFEVSISAPVMTNLRILAREGLISKEDANKVLTLPATMRDMVDVFLNNKKAMLERFSNDAGVPFHFKIIESYQKKEHLETEQLLVFADEKNQEELVFGISVNGQYRQIILRYRGSVSKKDYEKDFNVLMSSYPNPLNPGEALGIHSGFSGYLFQKTESGKAKFDIIVEHLKELFKKHPDYKLYVTGHSLGGSLALLTAYQLAWNCQIFEIPSPITVVAFGPLLVGDLQFQRAYQQMEKRKRIVSLTCNNDGDLIPRIPHHGGKTFYCRIGYQLILYRNRNSDSDDGTSSSNTSSTIGDNAEKTGDSNRKYMKKLNNVINSDINKRKCLRSTCITHPPLESNSWIKAAVSDVPQQAMNILRMLDSVVFRKNFVVHHSCIEYYNRLADATDLKDMTYQDLYSQRFEQSQT